MASNTFEGVGDRLDALERTLSAPPESLTIRDETEWAAAAGAGGHAPGRAWRWSPETCPPPSRTPTSALARAAPDDQLTVASASALKGLASWASGDLLAALQAYQAATQGLVATGHVSDALACTVTVVDLELQRGNLDAARDAAQHALELAEATAASTGSPGGEVVRGTADMWTALAAWRGNEATPRRQHSTWVGPVTSVRPPDCRSSRTGGGSRWRTCGRARATRRPRPPCSRRLSALFNSDFSPNVRPVPAVLARLHLRVGDLAAARSWAATAGVAADDELTTCASTST